MYLRVIRYGLKLENQRFLYRLNKIKECPKLHWMRWGIIDQRKRKRMNRHLADHSNLTMVSLTGADDHISVLDLVEFQRQHPAVEWGILYVPGKEGQPRNPTQPWREEFFSQCQHHEMQSAVHLCGTQAFEQLKSKTLPPELLKAQRWQLNANARRPEFNKFELQDLYQSALDYPGFEGEVILQFHEHSSEAVDAFLSGKCRSGHLHELARIGVLLDDSRGKGVETQNWRISSGMRRNLLASVGLAGGIGPQNSDRAVQNGRQLGRPFWIDMESGIRTENEFDLGKGAATYLRAMSISKTV